jgi:hypothetical protein
MSQTSFTKILKGLTMNVTGTVAPLGIFAGLGTSKRPAVKETVNGFTYQSAA